MSSNSPALRLRIADSPLSRITFVFFAALALGALVHAWVRGYPWLAFGMAPLFTWLCWGLRHVPQRGAELSWSAGEWRLAVGGRALPIALEAGAVALPWVVFVPYRGAVCGRRCLWVYVDSVSPDDWRRLRVRIRLPDPGRGGRW